jgi:hypothetical protein
MTAWVPEWRVTVGDDTYTTVTAVNYNTGRIDIDKQPNAGYAQIEILNIDNSPFTIDVTDSVTLELKQSDGTYYPVFGGQVSDFSISVRSPEESGYITRGTIIAIGTLSKLTKAVFTDALPEALDGEQILDILEGLLINSWFEVAPSLEWADYDPTTTWANAENVGLDTIDTGLYTMDALSSGSYVMKDLIDQIANSALGQIYEDNQGRIAYADADHRTTYLAANGFTEIDGSFARPTTVSSTLQIGRIRNSLIYHYGNDYNTDLEAIDTNSVATYGRFQRDINSNIKNTSDMETIATRELTLRATPRAMLDSITFRLDNPDMGDTLRDNLINIAFGEPVLITNLPSNMFNGQFDGFVESVKLSATTSYVDLTLYVSPTDFSLVAPQWETVSPASLAWTGVNATLTWTNAIGALT